MKIEKNRNLMFLFSGFLFVSSGANASTIYSDEFSGNNGDSLIARLPDVSDGVLNASWGGPTTIWPQDIQENRAGLGADTHVSLDIASGGDFVQPKLIRVSAIMNLGNISGPATPDDQEVQRGVGLGFYEGIVSVATNSDFRGLVLGTDGRLVLARAGANGSARAGFLAEVTTGIDTSIDHTVSYEIDTETGDISNIFLDGVMQGDVTTTIFDADVNRVGFFASSVAGGRRASFDDFTVTDVLASAPSVAPVITSITRIDATTYELSIVASPDTEFGVGASETLDFENGLIVLGLTQGSVDDPGEVSAGGDIITTDENGNATFRMTSAATKNFVRMQPPISVGS